MDDGYVSAEQAARALGVGKRAVRNMVTSGKLEARRAGEGVAARLMVSVVSIERLRSERETRRATSGRRPALS